jgi:hypothetical protein
MTGPDELQLDHTLFTTCRFPLIGGTRDSRIRRRLSATQRRVRGRLHAEYGRELGRDVVRPSPVADLRAESGHNVP